MPNKGSRAYLLERRGCLVRVKEKKVRNSIFEVYSGEGWKEIWSIEETGVESEKEKEKSSKVDSERKKTKKYGNTNLDGCLLKIKESYSCK